MPCSLPSSLRELLKTNETSQEILHTHYDDLRDKVKDIEQQREAAMKDFEGLDKSFADLHQRYLRLKQSSDSQQQVLSALGKIYPSNEPCIILGGVSRLLHVCICTALCSV